MFKQQVTLWHRTWSYSPSKRVALCNVSINQKGVAMRVRHLNAKQIGEYFNPKYLLRPVSKALVSNYAALMEGGTEFPAIVCGTCPNPDPKKPGRLRLIIDGVHIFKAMTEAKKSKHPVEFVSFESLAAALADQLRRNIMHGFQVSTARRDARIKELIDEYKWTVRDVATAVGLHYSSVSRINRDMQNLSKTGKRGPKRAAERPSNVVPHALPPKQFIRAVENLALTLEKPEASIEAVKEIYNREPKEVQRLVSLLHAVAARLDSLVTAQPVTAAPRTRKPITAAQLQAAA